MNGPTQEQIKLAQDAGNKAYEYQRDVYAGNGSQCYDAYRAAYNETLYRLTVGQAEQRRMLQECGAELEDSPRDWRDLRGDCAL